MIGCCFVALVSFRMWCELGVGGGVGLVTITLFGLITVLSLVTISGSNSYLSYPHNYSSYPHNCLSSIHNYSSSIHNYLSYPHNCLSYPYNYLCCFFIFTPSILVIVSVPYF